MGCQLFLMHQRQSFHIEHEQYWLKHKADHAKLLLYHDMNIDELRYEHDMDHSDHDSALIELENDLFYHEIQEHN